MLNKLLQREKRKSELPCTFSDGLSSFTNSFDIVIKCNDFFVGTDYELAQKIPSCHGDPVDFIQCNFSVISLSNPSDIQEIRNK